MIMVSSITQLWYMLTGFSCQMSHPSPVTPPDVWHHVGRPHVYHGAILALGAGTWRGQMCGPHNAWIWWWWPPMKKSTASEVAGRSFVKGAVHTYLRLLHVSLTVCAAHMAGWARR